MLLLNLITALYICAQDFSKWGEKTRMTPPPPSCPGGVGAKLYLPLPHVHTNDYESYTKF